jgi:hypothetical protein
LALLYPSFPYFEGFVNHPCANYLSHRCLFQGHHLQ